MPDNLTRRILITRPQPAAGEFSDRLRREGFSTLIAPMTEYVELDHHIGDIARYQGVIFTSAQGVHIFGRSFTERYIPAFAVGDATAHTAEEAGFQRVFSAQGDTAALQTLVATEKTKLNLKNMLHVCGEDTAEDLGKPLQDIGVHVDRVPVYKAVFIDKMQAETAEALKKNEISVVTLLSARTAANFVKLVQADPALSGTTQGVEAICLSDRVAAEIKALPWRIIRIAVSPNLDAVMDILREKAADQPAAPAMPADAVIAAFGGIRPLAGKLDITPSTVQGWKERGTVPEARVGAVLKAAHDNGIDIKTLWQRLEGTPPMAPNDSGAKTPAQAAGDKTPQHRPRGEDRRQRYATPDNHGNIRADGYSGPDRRAGVDRRAFQERQEARIRGEKWRFLNRSMVMGSIFTVCCLYGAGLLLAPEIFTIKGKSDQMQQMQSKMDELNGRLALLQREKAAREKELADQRSLGQRLSDRIGQVEHAVDAVGGAAQAVSNTASTAAHTATALAGNSETGRNIAAFLNMLANLNSMNNSAEGRKASSNAMTHLQGALAGSGTDADSLNAAVAAARANDKTLAKLMGGVSAKDLGAAALLLGLNEFRNNINTSQSFEHDLMLMQKFAGNDPAMQESLKRLAPYARSGVLNRQQLQAEFKGLASDIVMAKLQGQDADVQAQVMQRMSKLVKVRKIDDIQGSSVDAVVARAQLKLNQNDVRGAMQELQSLEGAPAETAAPFMEQAQGTVLADDASAQLLQTIMTRLQDPANLSLEGLQGLASDVTGGAGFSGIGDALGISGLGSALGGGGSGPIPLGAPGFNAGSSGGDDGGAFGQ